MIKKSMSWLGLVFLLSVIGATVAAAQDVPRMTVDELKGLLGNPDLVIIDVRTNGDWNGAKEKIAGAVREDPHDVESWAKKYPKEKTLVLYCT